MWAYMVQGAQATSIAPLVTSHDRLLLVVRELTVSTRQRRRFVQSPSAIHFVTGIQTSKLPRSQSSTHVIKSSDSSGGVPTPDEVHQYLHFYARYDMG